MLKSARIYHTLTVLHVFVPSIHLTAANFIEGFIETQLVRIVVSKVNIFPTKNPCIGALNGYVAFPYRHESGKSCEEAGDYETWHFTNAPLLRVKICRQRM